MVALEDALGNAGLSIDELVPGEATIQLLGFRNAGCDAIELILCAKATVQLEPDLPRSLEMAVYCESLVEEKQAEFQRCLE